MNLKIFKNIMYGGFGKGELAIMTASQGTGNTVMNYLNEGAVYHIMNEESSYEFPVYRTVPGQLLKRGNHHSSLQLLMNANIAFIVDDGRIRLIKNRYGQHGIIVTDKEEVKKYRWYILQAVDA